VFGSFRDSSWEDGKKERSGYREGKKAGDQGMRVAHARKRARGREGEREKQTDRERERQIERARASERARLQ
jgi:hypothetical protein